MASRLGESIPTHLKTEARRVPGCVSVVHIAAELAQAGDGMPLEKSVVTVRGSADARVARYVGVALKFAFGTMSSLTTRPPTCRGMLALVIDGLEGLTADTILSIDANDIIERAKIRWGAIPY